MITKQEIKKVVTYLKKENVKSNKKAKLYCRQKANIVDMILNEERTKRRKYRAVKIYNTKYNIQKPLHCAPVVLQDNTLWRGNMKKIEGTNARVSYNKEYKVLKYQVVNKECLNCIVFHGVLEMDYIQLLTTDNLLKTVKRLMDNYYYFYF